MIHHAVSGRFLMAGPAIAVPVLFKEMRDVAAANLRDGGQDAAGLTRWMMSGTIQNFDDVGPWLVQQHEHDHVELFGSTPTGVLLVKLHQIQSGRLNYLLTKLSHHLGKETLSVRPPFLEWFRSFAASKLGVRDRTGVLDAPQLTRDPVWAHCAAIVSEIETYQRAGWVLLSSRLDDLNRDVAALNEALRCIAGFHMVTQPRPRIRLGDATRISEVQRWKLTGNAIFEGHALLQELQTLTAGHATHDVIYRWHASRLWSPGDRTTPLNEGVRVLDLLESIAEQGGPRFPFDTQRLLLELALLAPLDPATWAAEELPLDAIHPTLRFLQLLEFFLQVGSTSANEVSVRDIDAIFEHFEWPTLTEISRRALTQEPFGAEVSRVARSQYAALGIHPVDIAPVDPLQITRDSLRAGLAMRSKEPGVFAALRERFPIPTPLEYYWDAVFLRDGFTPTTLSRHRRVVESLLAAWLLHGDDAYFKLASQAHMAMLGYLRAWHQDLKHTGHDKANMLDTSLPALEQILRDVYHADPPDLFNQA